MYKKILWLLVVFTVSTAFMSCASTSDKAVDNSKNTNKITTQEWLEKNKNSPVLRNGNGKTYYLLLSNVLEPGSVSLSHAPSGDSATLDGLTRQVNSSYEKEYTEDQIKQIYFIAKEKNKNITEVIDNSIIDSNGSIIYNKTAEGI